MLDKIHTIEQGTTPVVCIPGWATDWRIFRNLALPARLIIPGYAWMPGLDEQLSALDTPCTVIGWSLGGFIAAAFARAYPQLVSHLVLVSVRQKYPPVQIDAMRDALRVDKAGCLTTFYRQCFLPGQREDYRRFREELQGSYLEEFSAESLDEGLACLARQELTPDNLPSCRTTLVHGTEDVIAPITEARALAVASTVGWYEIAGAAHAVPLAEFFQTWCAHE